MRGQILVFNEQKEAGAIITEDGRRFLFHINDWQDVVPPDRGMAVSFMLDADNRARQVQLAVPESVAPPGAAMQSSAPPQGRQARPKRKPVITLLALFLGIFGAHRFYMGAWGWGLVQLLGTFIGIGIVAALVPPLGGLLYFAVIVLTWVEAIRYIWMTDNEFKVRVRMYQHRHPGPFSFFW